MSLAVVVGGLLPRSAAAQCPIRAPAMVPEPACPPPDPPSGPIDTRFLKYPYEDDNKGHAVQSPREDRYRPGRELWGRIAAEGGFIPKNHGRARLGLRAGTDFLELDSAAQAVTGLPGRHAFYVGSTSLSYPFVGERGTVRFGGGLRYHVLGRLPSGGIAEGGVGWNLATSTDIFPIKPLVISSQLEVGQVQRRWTVQWRASAGVVLRGVEVMASLDYFAMKGLRFGGPMFGVRLWM